MQALPLKWLLPVREALGSDAVAHAAARSLLTSPRSQSSAPTGTQRHQDRQQELPPLPHVSGSALPSSLVSAADQCQQLPQQAAVSAFFA